MIDKNNFFINFLGQNKNKKILIGICDSIDMNKTKLFLSLFKDIEYELIIYNSDKSLEEKLNNSNQIVIVILSNKNIEIQDVKNDTRLFLFQVSNNKYINVNILEHAEIVYFNFFIDNFFLSKSYIKYKSLNDSLFLNISALNGFGVFTHNKIIKGQKLLSLYGEIVNKEFLNNKNFFGEWNALADNKFLVRKDRTSYGFINHSRRPNCQIYVDSMDIIAIRNIEKDEEILLDYRNEPLPKEYINGFGKTYL